MHVAVRTRLPSRSYEPPVDAEMDGKEPRSPGPDSSSSLESPGRQALADPGFHVPHFPSSSPDARLVPPVQAGNGDDSSLYPVHGIQGAFSPRVQTSVNVRHGALPLMSSHHAGGLQVQ